MNLSLFHFIYQSNISNKLLFTLLFSLSGCFNDQRQNSWADSTHCKSTLQPPNWYSPQNQRALGRGDVGSISELFVFFQRIVSFNSQLYKSCSVSILTRTLSFVYFFFSSTLLTISLLRKRPRLSLRINGPRNPKLIQSTQNHFIRFPSYSPFILSSFSFSLEFSIHFHWILPDVSNKIFSANFSRSIVPKSLSIRKFAQFWFFYSFIRCFDALHY